MAKALQFELAEKIYNSEPVKLDREKSTDTRNSPLSIQMERNVPNATWIPQENC